MSQLVKYEAACRAIAECKSIDEVKTWADKAAAMQAYGRMAKDKTLEVDAAEIRIRAERRLGEMLAATKAEGGLNPAATLKRGPVVVANDHGKPTAPTLADAGISKDLSSRAQKLAAVPEATFEAELSAKRERNMQDGARVSARLEKIGAQQLQKTAKQIEAEQAAEDAFGESDPLQLVEELQRENEKLVALVKAAEADDLKAEAMKWRRSYEHALRQQSEAMDRASKSVEREAWTVKQLRRCGKAIGEEDPTKIAAAVEAFVRQHKKVAA